MSEIRDLVMPVLQKIQLDQAEFRRETKGVLADHTAKLNELGETMEALSGYITYQMGITMQNQSDIKDLQEQMRDLTGRVTALETGH
jgi:hypothetical protein